MALRLKIRGSRVVGSKRFKMAGLSAKGLSESELKLS
jgi:hypothetical protein